MKQITLFLFFINVVFSQSDVPLTLRAQFNGSYGYTIIGNTLNEFDNFQPIPTPPCQILTQSSATLNLLPSQNIVAAYLYWGGIGDGSYNPIIQLNGINFSASQTFVGYPETNPIISCFNSFIDVTNLLQITGNGIYNFSNLNLNPIIGNYCSTSSYNSAWHIVVIYSESLLPNSQINVYDGVNVMSGLFNNGITPLIIDNLNIVNTNNTKFTYVGLNGSPNLYFNENVTVNGNILSNALNPADNPFNGTNTFSGSNTNWNQDIDTFDISSFVNIGDTQANLSFNSFYYRYIQTVVTSIRSELPDATAEITNITGQEICNNRILNLSFKLKNNNANAPLPIDTPFAVYADDVVLFTSSLIEEIPVGGELLFNIDILIPNYIPNNFIVKVVSNSNGLATALVSESNENNNESTLAVSLINNIIPTFNVSSVVCQNTTSTILPSTSTNGITGTWLPTTIDNQNSGTYIFTPNSGQCATSFTLNTTITPSVSPSFSINSTFCQNSAVPILPPTSSNGITGTWLPNVIDNQNSGTYIFTPDTGQCSATYTLNTTITSTLTPSFSLNSTFCQNNSVPILPLTSTNGISGTWLPNVISNQISGTYIFTPDAGQCASNFTLDTTVFPDSGFTFSYEIANDFGIEQIITVEASGGSGPFLYSFNGFPFQNNTSYQTTPNDVEILVKVKEAVDTENCFVAEELVLLWKYPKFFTPNSDGYNDSWGINSDKEIKIEIFDRFGKLVKVMKNNETWNGTFNQQLLPASDYWFIIYYNSKVFRSHFTLKR